MKVDGQQQRSIWHDGDDVFVIDQLRLPFTFDVHQLHTLAHAVDAIASMRVRGAPLIGATAAFGIALAARHDATDAALERAASALCAARPTAVNLRWAVRRTLDSIVNLPVPQRARAAFECAAAIADEDVAINMRIGEHGLNVLRDLAARNPGRPLNVLTHCNAGWLATVDWGTAMAPVYMGAREGLDVHVWVDETRPRLQGALTAWELAQEGVPHTIIADNAGGHLMQSGAVDVVITGTDRVAGNGDAANKIGTYLKALAAHDNGIPFYVAAPTPSIDRAISQGASIPIEERDSRELSHVRGVTNSGVLADVGVFPHGSRISNFGFDVTPARLITGLITEHGVVPAQEHAISGLFEAVHA